MMRSFKEIEKDFGSFTFRDEEKSGHVALCGKKTLIKIDSANYLNFSKGEDGLFSFQTVVHGKTRVKFENAFYTLHPHLVNVRRECRAEAYANTVIIDSDALGKGDTLTEVQFELQDLSNHFNYKLMEHIYLDKEDIKFSRAPKSHKARKTKQLEGLTGVDLKETESVGGRVSEIYTLRRYPKIFRFRLGDRIFECFYGYSQKGFGWRGIELKPRIYLRIAFDAPVSTQEALDVAFELRRFFSQQQLGPISFSGIYGRSRSRKAHRFCSFYIPSEASIIRKKTSANYNAHPASIVLNGWSQRESLTVLLAQWLKYGEQRRRYRILIDAVGNEIVARFSLEQLASLCSAVESLDELKGADDIARNVVRDMTVAAKEAAAKHGLALPEDRIHSCLSLLKRNSLSHRVKLMFTAINKYYQKLDIDINIITKSINEIRTIAVHGSPLPEDIEQKTFLTNRALYAMCVLYDVLTCDSEKRIKSAGKGHPAVHALRESYVLLRNKNINK